METNHTNNNIKESTCKATGQICLSGSNLPRVIIISNGFAGLQLIEKPKNKELQVVLFDKNNFYPLQPLFYPYEKSNRMIIRNFKAKTKKLITKANNPKEIIIN